MSESLGILELRSISRGIQAADAMTKKSPCDLQVLRMTCPGKILVIVSGESAEVLEAMEVGTKVAERFLMDQYIIHSISPAILTAMKHKYTPGEMDAIGILETIHIASGLSALDKSLKEADVRLIKLSLGQSIGGKLVYVITGSVSNVEQAIHASLKAIPQKLIVDYTVIPSPSSVIKNFL
ncbi:BMC domain-containing protein [Microbacteriaceae bacterium 4G12]